jgi:transposase InsO family protein
VISPREAENKIIRTQILTIYTKAKKRFGPAKIRASLAAEYGIKISLNRVSRLMKSMQLPKMSTIKPYKPASDTVQTASLVNKIKQNFNPVAPNMVWASDVTYVKAGGEWAYVCAILDLYARKLISFSVSKKFDWKLIEVTLRKGFKARGNPQNLIFHSDQGSQYTSGDFRKVCDELHITQSFSKPGYPYDNACCEAFFKYLKKEDLNRKSFSSVDTLELAVFEYANFYNKNRPHSAISYNTPEQKEASFFSVSTS